MSNECAHTLESGNKCHAPALGGNAFCRHHDLNKRMDASRASEPFVLPEFYDARGVLRAVNQVCRALTEQRIKRSTAGTLLFGLQFAARLIREIKEETKDQLQTALPDFTPTLKPIRPFSATRSNASARWLRRRAWTKPRNSGSRNRAS